MTSRRAREALDKSWRMSGGRIGMGCKADFAVNSPAIGKEFNAADRPGPDDRAPRGACSALPYFSSSFMPGSPLAMAAM